MNPHLIVLTIIIEDAMPHLLQYLLTFDILYTRYGNFEDVIRRMEDIEGGIQEMAKGFNYFGCHVDEENTFTCRQWAPSAKEMWLMGDFNDWRCGKIVFAFC